LLRQRRVVADAGAGFLDLFVARLGDVLRHLAGLAAVGILGLGHRDEPATIGRERAVDDVDVLAQVSRRRRARRIGLAPLLVLFAHGVAARAVVAQGAQHVELAGLQALGRGCLGWIILGLEQRGLCGAVRGGPAEPVVA